MQTPGTETFKMLSTTRIVLIFPICSRWCNVEFAFIMHLLQNTPDNKGVITLEMPGNNRKPR